MQNIIKYTGLKNLNEIEQNTLIKIVEKEYPKIQIIIKNKSDLTVKVKTVKRSTKKRFMIYFRLDAPMKSFGVKRKDTERGGDWDLAKATHKALKALQFEIKHALRADTETWKKGGIKKLVNRLKF